MAYKFDISQLTPLKFYPLTDLIESVTATGINMYNVFNPNLNYKEFDDEFYFRNINSWEEKRIWFQPYQKGDIIYIQFLGIDTTPTAVYTTYLIDKDNQIVNTYAVTEPTGTVINGQIIKECSIPLYNVDEGYYRVVIRCRTTITGTPSVNEYAFVISEPIHVKERHENSQLIKYKHSEYTQGTFFEFGLEYQLRTYGVVHELVTQSKFEVYEDEPMNLTLLSGVPYRLWTWGIGGDGNPIPEWFADKIERLSLCDSLEIDGKNYTRSADSKLEANRKQRTGLCSYKLPLRERYTDNSVYIEQYEKPIILLSDVKYTRLIYVQELEKTATTYAIDLFFDGIYNFVDYLNSVFAKAQSLGGKFGIDAQDNLVYIASSTSERSTYATLVVNGVLYYGLELVVELDGTNTDLVVNIDDSSAFNYAINYGDGTSTSAGTSSSISLSHDYAISQKKKFTCKLCVDRAMNIDFDTTTIQIKSVGGDLPPNIETFTIQNLGLKEVRNNLFEHITDGGTSIAFSLTQNRLGQSELDKVIKHAYISSDNLNNGVIELDDQTPLSSPSSQVVEVLIPTLTQKNITIVVD